jgi:tetratricopeptide (TPR) repeat protein
MRGKFDDALRVFNWLPSRLTDEETTLKSWALLVMGQEEEALRLLDTLPERMRNSPAVAMIRAEHAVRGGHPEEVALNVMLAANDMRLIQRVRMFFPYLAMHEQWEAIHKCENALPYKDLAQALLSVHAHLKMNDASAAASVLTQVLEKWPDSPMCLNSLFAIALRRPGGYWEERFAESFRKNASLLDADILPYYMNYCFQMQRPELGWLAYRRMQEKDPGDPGLLMASVRFGENWFLMRRRQVKVGAEAVEERIDLRPFYYLTRHMAPFNAFWREIPLLDELKDRKHIETVRREYLSQAIREFERREKDGALTLRMAMAFPGALAMDKRYPEAHAKLDSLEKKYPDMRQEITLQRATFYDQCGEMERSYELLRSWFAEEKIPSLTSALLMINAMMNLDMGVCAMDVVSKAEAVFPGAGQVGIATAGILDVFGQKEQALFTLARFQTDLRYSAGVQLLYDSGRYEEAEKMSRVFGVQLKRKTDQSQILGVLPAEFAIRRRLPPPVSMEEATRAIESFSIAAEKTPNPFFRAFAKKLTEWYRQADGGNVDEWQNIGRDKYEKITTLHRLAVLQARQKKYDVAITAIDRAVELMPDSPFLRRIQIMLKEGDAATVEAAFRACPDDPEVWLASLVVRYQRGGEKNKEWAMEEITRATETDRFPLGDIVRAGDFFLRMNMKEVAVKAAKYAIPRCRGYLPAYALGVRCGVLTGDLKWALECSLLGIENARDPRPFYTVLTDIKIRNKQLDNDLIAGLEYLQNRAPEQKIWSEILGTVYFEKKDTKRAMSVLTPIIYEDMRGVRVQSLLLAAESARVEGEMTKAVDILEMANAMYPERLSVLNNLVYSLAQNDQTLDKARMLLPRLLDMGGDSYAVLDTASTVYMRSGDTRRAREYMERALSTMKKDAYGASEVNLNAARLFFNAGDYEAARRKAEEVRNSPEAGRLVEAHARALLEQIKAIKR